MTQQHYAQTSIKWAELVPTLIGRYSISITIDHHGQSHPCLEDTFDAANADLIDMREQYQQDVVAGERDPEDEYEGIVFPCVQEGDEIILLSMDDYIEIDRFNWKMSSGV